MRQDNNSSIKGNQARPSDRAATLAGRLASVHPADVLQGSTILAEFAGSNMQDPAYTAGHGGTHSQTEELAATVIAVLRSSPREFSGLLPDYVRLLGMVRAFLIRQDGNALAIAQLDRIAKALAVEDAAVIAAAPARPGLRQIVHDKAVIAAAVCLALLLFDLTSDHFPIWQLLAAIALLAGVCPLMFRIGAKHGSLQTPVKTKP